MLSDHTLTDGVRLKEQVHAEFETRSADLLLRARRKLLQVLLTKGLATMEDVRAKVPLPPGVNPNAFGAVPGPLVKSRLIAASGYSTATRREAHARPLTLWRLTDREAAERWLVEHPEPEAPANGIRQQAFFFAHEKGAAGCSR